MRRFKRLNSSTLVSIVALSTLLTPGFTTVASATGISQLHSKTTSTNRH